MTEKLDREALVEKAATVIRNAMYSPDASVEMLADDELEFFSGVARAALAVFEEAHTPTEAPPADDRMVIYANSNPETKGSE